MITKSERPFWDFLLSIKIITWFINLPISKKVMKNKLAQKLFNYEAITYIFYGVLTTIVNLVIYRLIYKTAAPKDETQARIITAVATIIAWIIAMLFAFVTNKLIVFKSPSFKKEILWPEFTSFTIARLLSLGFEFIIMLGSTFISTTEFFNTCAKVFAMIFVVIINYIFSKLFIFKNKIQHKEIQVNDDRINDTSN